jgi:hypothetical protein
VTVAFKSDSGLTWQADCNTAGANVEVTDDHLNVGQIVSTEIGCPGRRAKQDRDLAAFFESDPGWRLEGNRLTLSGDEVEVVLQATSGLPGSDLASSSGSTTADKLDCGNTKRSAKRALRSFVGVLRSGEERRILTLLAKPRRFFALSAGYRDGSGIVSSGDRREAAAQVSDYGGLPLRIDRFMNADRPSRTTDLGYFATWRGRREAVGKAALDCRAGTAIVLAVAIGG